ADILLRVAFVTNICPHYRVKTFETFARRHDAEFFFYSAGNEWYWQQDHGARAGNFRHAYLPGFQLTRRTRVVPSLLTRLWRGRYDVFVKCINGRFALPVTYLIVGCGANRLCCGRGSGCLYSPRFTAWHFH